MKAYTFTVEEIYTGLSLSDNVIFDEETVSKIVRFLREVDCEANIYTSSIKEHLPDVYNKINDAAIPLMDKLDALHPGGYYRAYIPRVILAMAGENVIRYNS